MSFENTQRFLLSRLTIQSESRVQMRFCCLFKYSSSFCLKEEGMMYLLPQHLHQQRRLLPMEQAISSESAQNSCEQWAGENNRSSTQTKGCEGQRTGSVNILWGEERNEKVWQSVPWKRREENGNKKHYISTCAVFLFFMQNVQSLITEDEFDRDKIIIGEIPFWIKEFSARPWRPLLHSELIFPHFRRFSATQQRLCWRAPTNGRAELEYWRLHYVPVSHSGLHTTQESSQVKGKAFLKEMHFSRLSMLEFWTTVILNWEMLETLKIMLVTIWCDTTRCHT